MSPSTATISDVARALAKGLKAGTIRTRSGQPYKPSVIRRYESSLRVHALPSIGRRRIAHITRGELQGFLDELAAEKSPETARKTLTALQVLSRFAQREGLVDQRPTDGVQSPGTSVAERPARVLTLAEIDGIVAAATADDEHRGRSLAEPLLVLAFGTGLRQGELLALAWGEGVDLKGGTVTVRASLDRDPDEKGEMRVTAPKSRAAHREVPLGERETIALRRHYLAQGRPADGSLVFCTDEGSPLQAKGVVRGAWKRAVSQAKIDEPLPTFHDARHAAATHFLAAGLDAHTVAKLLGHRDAGLVNRRYGHALPDRVANAAKLLDAYRSSHGV